MCRKFKTISIASLFVVGCFVGLQNIKNMIDSCVFMETTHWNMYKYIFSHKFLGDHQI